MNRVVLVSFAGCAAVLLAACGADQHQSTVDPKVRASLVAGVNRVESAARNRDRPGAEVALAGLTRDIATRQARGQIDPDTAQKMLAAADRVAEDVRTLPAQRAPGSTVVVPAPGATGSPASSGEGAVGVRERGRSGGSGASSGASSSGPSSGTSSGAASSRYRPTSDPPASSVTSIPVAPRVEPEVAAGSGHGRGTRHSHTSDASYSESGTTAGATSSATSGAASDAAEE